MTWRPTVGTRRPDGQRWQPQVTRWTRLHLSDSDRAELVQLAGAASTPRRLAIQARALVLMDSDLDCLAVAHRCGVSGTSVRQWARLFAALGIASVGRPTAISEVPRPTSISEVPIPPGVLEAVESFLAARAGSQITAMAEDAFWAYATADNGALWDCWEQLLADPS